MAEATFTPALGHSKLTGAYDLALRLLTREKTWRSALLAQVAPRNGEAILDVGCGTGSFAILLKLAAPGAHVCGLDPDPEVLHRAAKKAANTGVDIEWRQGFARDAAAGAKYDKIVSSLVFHQVPIAEKRAGITAMLAAVNGDGEVHIADYARQDSWLMRRLFGIVQQIDGHANTQPNADGMLESILADIHLGAGKAHRVIPTPTGAISLFRVRPDIAT